ncbi:CU044_5270 family protein [Actinoplanes sp. NPDC051861]|uniref:CU044_5270 family protein n=1 Tax=Actinoplanes sp. NPDC051861 TaxID=3155170 RepID=UPI00342213ED
MDEITLTRELGEETDLPSPKRLTAARNRLLSEMSTTTTRTPRKWTIIGTAAAAAAAIAAVTVPGALSPTASPIPTNPAGPVETTPELVPVAAFLNQAATVAEQAPDTVPRGDQFVYVDSEGMMGDAWYSIDGEHDGLVTSDGFPEQVIPGCKNGIMAVPNETGDVKCKPEPHYLPDLPADPKKLAAWLREQHPGEGNEKFSLNGVGKHLWALSSNYWLRPAQRAALYRSIAEVEGLELVENVADASGRRGTGVAWASGPGEKAQVIWIFDPETHVLLGNKDYTVKAVKLVDRVGATG